MKTCIVFFGSSIHSIPTLGKLINAGYEIAAVVTQPDKETPNPVSEFAQKRHISVIKPQSSKAILQHKPDLLVVTYYGVKIPIDLINKVKFGGVNIHPSLLPKYRGAAPAEWAILNGEKEVGVTILTLSENFDEGEIVAQIKEPILNNDTAEDLYTRLFETGADLLIKILPDFLQGKIKLTSQDNTKATFAPKLKREDGKIDWQKRPAEIERMIRAFYPWPGTWTEVRIKKQESRRLKILKAHLEKRNLVLDEVQLEGKKPVSFEEFKRGYPNFQFIQ